VVKGLKLCKVHLVVPRPPYRRFVAAVSVTGLWLLLVIAVTRAVGVLEHADALFALLALAILIAELFPVDLPDEWGQVSFSTTFAFAILLTDGVAAVVLVLALALAVADTVRRRPVERLVFNVAQYTISWAVAGGVLVALTGDLPDREGLQYLDAQWIPALVASAAAFLLVNTALASVPPALAHGIDPLTAVRSDFAFHAWSTVVLVALVPVILAASEYDLWLFPLLGVPLVAIQLGSRQTVINEQQARTDALTGLPNRVQLTRSLREALRRAGGAGGRVGVLIVGLDRFKDLNETLGHRRGDVVLQEAGRRLAALTRPGDVVARLGGDEFAIVLGPVDGQDGCVRMAAKLIARLREPVEVSGVALDIGASVGIACHPDHGRSVDALLRHADVALDRAKTSRRDWVVYQHDFDEHSLERLAILAELRRGIDRGELLLHFQPQIELATGTLRGVEALVRWRHPERGLLAPQEFVGLAEHTGLIRPLTLWVVEEALKHADGWRAAGLDVPVAVNLSVRSITHELPADLSGILSRRERETSLELEITETLGMEDADEALTVLRELTRLGIRLSVDDYGTGFSSLAYLKRLPVSALKIDRSFVTEMDHDQGDHAIVRSTIDLAHHLGMEVVAEGVETEQALQELRHLGCHLAQGFLISPPLPSEALESWLAKGGFQPAWAELQAARSPTARRSP
jgi:diguanylate cyclase (GGDEF)-like protein